MSRRAIYFNVQRLVASRWRKQLNLDLADKTKEIIRWPAQSIEHSNRVPVLFIGEGGMERAARQERHPAEFIQLLAPADNDLLEAFPVTRDLLKIKEPGREMLEPVAS
jgi:hypothetical protein